MGDNTYSSNWVWCLADELWEGTKAINGKNNLKTPGRSHVAKYPMVPKSMPLNFNSRITLLAHGDSASTHIMSDNKQWNAVEFADFLGKVVKGIMRCDSIKRISFHMCYGAKAESGGTIYNSFAHKFASVCDFAEEVVGRTNVVSANIWETDSDKRPGVNDGFEWLVVDSNGVYRHKLADGKMLYKPRGGTLKLPVNPVSTVVNYD